MMKTPRRSLLLSECAAVLLVVQSLGLCFDVSESWHKTAAQWALALVVVLLALVTWLRWPRFLGYVVAGALMAVAAAGLGLAPFGHRSVLHLIVVAMPGVALAMLAVVYWGRIAPSKPLATALSLALVALLVDGLGQFWLAPLVIAESPGLCESDPQLGWRLRPRNGWKLYYSDNRRSYFDREPNDGLLDARLWLRNEGPTAPPLFSPATDRDGTIQVTFAEGSPPGVWSYQLYQEFWPVDAGDELILELEARASPPRDVEIVLPISWEPAKNNGLQTVAKVGDTWARHEFRARLLVTDETSRLHIACGGQAGEFSLRNARATINGAPPRQNPARRYSVVSRTNSQGFRWPRDYVLDNAGATRIALLGDSYTFGWGVRVEDTLGYVLEETLAKTNRRDSPIEVLNFAVPGYNSRQQRLCFEQVARAYRPQIVVVVMVFNDTEPSADLADREAPARRIWSMTLGGWLNQIGIDSAYDDYKVCCDELGQLADACRAADAELVLVAFRNDDFRRWMALVETVSDWAARHQVRFLDLGPTIQEYLHSDWEAGWVYDAFHPNEHVHRLAGETLARYLIEQELLD